MKHLKAILFLCASLLFIELANNKMTGVIISHLEREQAPTVDTLRGIEYNVTVTMYYAVVGQCDASPLITADGSKIDPAKASEHRWIAVSQDLLKKNGGQLCYGDFVEIKGTTDQDGIYRITDCMNKRFKNKIDILETVGSPMYKFNNISLTKIEWKTQTQQGSQLASL
jgi:hypothetical protein